MDRRTSGPSSGEALLFLTDEQLQVYRDQVQDFRKMVGAFVGQTGE